MSINWQWKDFMYPSNKMKYRLWNSLTGSFQIRNRFLKNKITVFTSVTWLPLGNGSIAFDKNFQYRVFIWFMFWGPLNPKEYFLKIGLSLSMHVYAWDCVENIQCFISPKLKIWSVSTRLSERLIAIRHLNKF